MIKDELAWHEKLSRLFPKHTSQLNKVSEADAEIVFLEHDRSIMAVTTDMICEEIQMGIYTDPFLMGWMTVVVNISDLCAVGAKPKYIILNEIFHKESEEAFIEKVQEGIAAACKAFNVFVLGGDTNFSSQTLLGATAIGFIEDTSKIVQRIGALEEDLIYTGSTLGLGNFYAFSAMQQFSTDIEFKPYPDIELSQIMAAYASSCIDTSDGLFHALYTVMKLNGIGITLNENLFNSIPKILQEYCVQLQVSPLTLLAGIVGEYELLFTIPRDKNEAFLKAIEKSQITVHNIGTVTNEKGLSVTLKDHTQSIDLDALVQAYMHSKGDIKTYIETLKTYTEF